MVLMEMKAVEEAVVREIAEKLGQTHASIGMAMLRYHGQGLLDRYTTDWKNEKVYSLSARGLERLDWLLEQNLNDSDDDDSE